MNDVVIMRLNSGEEVLCTVERIDGGWNVFDPTIIIPTPERNIGLAPWMPYAKTEKLTIMDNAIAFFATPVEQLANQYKSIHSKIITPSQSIVTA